MSPSPTKKPLAKKPLAPSAKKPLNLKMAPVKPKEPKPKAVKEPKPKAPKPPRRSVRSVVMDLIYEQKHTDTDILEKIGKEFPEKSINVNIIGACRSEINAGKRVHPTLGKPAGRVEQIIVIDGKKVKRSEKPEAAPKSRSVRAKVDPATDKLRTIAGIEPKPKTAAQRRTK
jgi:hypothetical protein